MNWIFWTVRHLVAVLVWLEIEKKTGEKIKFLEKDKQQVLDTLFFDFIDLAKKLQPKVVVAENVKGLLLGEAKAYVRQIYREFDLAGYYCQHWILDASKMGVPQKRERVFFINAVCMWSF
jgi:DNA (cytosine-5)-methyltransferase 1